MHLEGLNKSSKTTLKKPNFFNKIPIGIFNHLTTILFYCSIFIFLIAFNFAHNPLAGFWYQQFMPTPIGGQIKDIYFVDSLLGFAVSDSSIIKTTNGGDNWTIKLTGYYIFQRIKFLNSNTGFTCGGNNKLLKTINSGENWTIMTPSTIYPFDMAVLIEDTIWLVDAGNPTGGVFRTTNGGVNWEQQLNLGNQNPNKIYMYNARIGFISNSSASPNIYKTTNSGVNWNVNANGQWFNDIVFADSLTGWRGGFGNNIYKTTDGGLNWITQPLPSGPDLVIRTIYKFSLISRDTLWGVGGVMALGIQTRGILYRTTNGGNNWLFQLPDTSINNFIYYHVQFLNHRIGWAFFLNRGIHTTTGGDPIWYDGIRKISNEIPDDFKLFQNYPNPFNPKTIIKYQITNSKYQKETNVKLTIFDITGKELITLVNAEQSPGTYEVDFIEIGYSSGVYFYSLIIDGNIIDTKKMIFIK